MTSINGGGLSTTAGGFDVVDDGTYLLFQIDNVTKFQIRKSDGQFMIPSGVDSDVTLS